MSVFYSLLLDTCLLNHVVIVIFNYKHTLYQFCEISLPVCPSGDREGSILMLKKTGKEADMLPILLKKLFSRSSWTAVWLFHLTYDQ